MIKITHYFFCYFCLSLLSCLNSAGSIRAYLMAGYVLAMVLNIFFPHVLATVVMCHYMPGTATAIVFDLSLGLVYLSRALSENRIASHVFNAPARLL